MFLKPGDPLLKQTAIPISKDQLNSKEVQKMITRMLKIAQGQQKDSQKPVMVGLAAPQIGILKRVILVDVGANGKGQVGKIKVFINPKIVWNSKRKEQWYEGCYSIPGICGIVSRPKSIKMTAFELTPNLTSRGVATLPPGSHLDSRSHYVQNPPRWNQKLVKYTGYVARIILHEIDHLDGKLFVALIKNPNHLHQVKTAEFALYRNQQAWRNWPKKYPLPIANLRTKRV